MCYGILYYNIFTNNFIYFVWNSIDRISFDAIFCLVTFVTFWCNAWVTFVTFLIKIMCSLMHGQKSFTIFVLEILLKYQVTNWWLKNLLMRSNKEADFFPEINKSFTFPGMGHTHCFWNHLAWKLRTDFITSIFSFQKIHLHDPNHTKQTFLSLSPSWPKSHQANLPLPRQHFLHGYVLKHGFMYSDSIFDSYAVEAVWSV